GLEAEAEAAVARIDLEGRPDPEAAEEVGRALEAALGRRRDLCVDRLGERRREAFLRRRLHQVAIADERLLPDRILGGPQHERRLAVAAGGVDEDVLTVAHGRRKLAQTPLPVGERLVERR